jgi:hypothetical protein
LAKEWRGLRASRAWWLMVIATGPIVGVAFRNAVTTYGDISADPGCGIACSPLLGVWAPTFGAFEIIAILLLPFVAIRSLAGDRQSGALAIELQRPFSPVARVGPRLGAAQTVLSKMLALGAGWAVAFAAGAIAVGLWRAYGGHVSWPELFVVAVGHALNAMVTIAVALSIAAMTDHPSTAAVVALALTIGTWIVDFAAAIYGGWWERIAAYTPGSFVAMFQHGLVRTSTVLAAIVLAGVALVVTVIWIRPGVTVARRALRTAVAAGAGVALGLAVSLAPGSWDASETQINSFPAAEAEALSAIADPIRLEVHLAPQDARRTPFERGSMAKLRRAVPGAAIVYVARTSTGLYEQADPGYGEVRYQVGARSGASRALTDEAVVEMILGLASVTAADEREAPYRGFPLAVSPTGVTAAFFIVWPVAWAGIWFWSSSTVGASAPGRPS